MANFRIKARVLDLLGEQQIANCPTAISELFKNAYDAYAENSILDVYPNNDCAVLWDDGQGMSANDVNERWLVIGTSDKDAVDASIAPKGISKRPVQGEKGIGRLAISTLGDNLLLISRSVNPDSDNDPYVAAFLNWNIARNDRLMLEDIEVPIITFARMEDLESGIVEDMVEEFKTSLAKSKKANYWSSKKHGYLFDKIMGQLNGFSVDMYGIKRTNFMKFEHGTLFYIKNLNPDIPQYIRPPARNEEDETPNIELVQLLTNFQNHFENIHEHETDESKAIPFYVDVRRWDPEARVLSSVFMELQAIGPDDLEFYDHYIDVDFDSRGSYKGTLQVFDKTYQVKNTRARRAQNSCGPLRLRMWYFQGVEKDSKLDAEHFQLMRKKLARFGGLMVYRDGLRVLPYGRPDWDWLTFEERRSKGLGRYHFSYRRMFGYISITRKSNPYLRDKAGREGLIITPEYRSMRQIIIDFFSEISLKYFYKSDAFSKAKDELTAEAKLIEEEQKRRAELKQKLLEETSGKLYKLKSSKNLIDDILNSETEEMENILDLETPKDAINHFNQRLNELVRDVWIDVPSDISVGKDVELQRMLHDHHEAYSEFLKECKHARNRFNLVVNEKFKDARRIAGRKKTITDGFYKGVNEANSAKKDVLESIKNIFKQLEKSVESICNDHLQKLENVLLENTKFASAEEALKTDLENPFIIIGRIERMTAESVHAMENLQKRFEKYIKNFFSESRDLLIAAQAEEITELRAHVDKNLELVQLGLSVEIIDHDLNRLYRGIRTNLSRLKKLVHRAPNALSVTEELNAAFQHLEQKYKLMSPLYRGSYKSKTEITGSRILEYIKDFLSRLLDSTGVVITASEPFLELKIQEVSAMILPVFVNIVDNSIYWLQDESTPQIHFYLKDDVVVICDNGPGIHKAHLGEIFEPFFTTKPNGRGLGLYVARANLKRYGHEIWATNDSNYKTTFKGACFCIRFRKNSIVGDKNEP